MDALDTVSIAILLGSLLVLAGILSSLVALRFGAPLLLVFLLVGMLAGEGGPGGIKFDNVGAAYLVGSIALALILFDGGLRTRFASFRNVLAPSLVLATVGVLITTLLTAPVAKFVLGLGWIQALLVGAVVASTDAAAVFFLINARGLRLRPRVRGVLEVESGTNDPFAIFLALLLVEILLLGDQSWSHAAGHLSARCHSWLRHWFCRRTNHYLRAQPADARAGFARALCRGERAGGIRFRERTSCVGISGGLSCRPGCRQRADART